MGTRPHSSYVARDLADKEEALRHHNVMRQRTIEVSLAPDRTGGSHVLSYAHSADGDGSTLYGTPVKIFEKLRALENAGVEYVLINSIGGSRESLRRFAREIMSVFSRQRELEVVG